MAKWHPIRRGQVISPFGIGAMMDFPGESLMVGGLDAWLFDRDENRLRDERLAVRLGLGNEGYFLLPPQPPDTRNGRRGDHLPAVRFPLWHQCPRCGALKKAKWNDPGPPKCDSSVSSLKGKDPCGRLPEWRRWKMTPLRFIVACKNGHIEDFPWLPWAHRTGSTPLDQVNLCDSPALRLYTIGRVGLEGLIVECAGCGKRNSLRGCSGEGGLPGHTCSGNRPWLGPEAGEACDLRPLMLQRGGSNVYFAKVASSILIPPYSDAIRRVLDDPRVWGTLTSGMAEGGRPDPSRVEIVAQMKNLDAGKLRDAIELKLAGRSNAAEMADEVSYRRAEYRALLGPSGSSDGTFVLKPEDVSGYGDAVRDCFDQIVLVEKLAETRVLTGFSRVHPPSGEQFSDRDRRLLGLERKAWLPGIRVYGEGVFVSVRQDRIRDWEQMDGVGQRAAIMKSRLRRLAEVRGWPLRQLPTKFFLLHALAHVLVRRLSFNCGYGSSSLRERLYCDDHPDEPMAGILIYTAAGDCEGTLGGLVQQGKPGLLDQLLMDAISDAIWCSSDPVCVESNGQGSDSLNLAACHACLLLPETSCEEGNRLLDRACLVGLPQNPAAGFFRDLVGHVQEAQ